MSNPRLQFYEFITTFKDQIKQLLSDPSLGFNGNQQMENIRKLDNMYDKLILAKNVNSKLPIELFYRSLVVPYGEYIIKQDEQFFLQNNLAYSRIWKIFHFKKLTKYIIELQ